MTCKVETCSRIVRTAGYCNAHYLRWNRYGDPLATKPKKSFDEKFWDRVDKSGSCWSWTAARTPGGYGVQRHDRSDGGKLEYAHRYSYEHAYGPIPGGMVVDHACHNRSCVNPAHLQAVSQKQNAENRQGPKPGTSSGIRGVTWNKATQRWKAQVKHGPKNYYAGEYLTLQEAEQAAIDKRNELYTNNLKDRVAA